MYRLRFVILFCAVLLNISASSLNENQARASCTVTSYDQVANAVSSCSDITIDGITVPGGETLELNLKDDAKLTFAGTIVFAFKGWGGPLVHITGKGVTVEGQEGHVLNGQGELYWNGTSGSSITKPRFMLIETTGGSTISDINVLNCPRNCIYVQSSDLTITRWNIDCSDGDAKGGHNTDGFDVSSSHNIVIRDSVVKNQDDCVAVNMGSNMYFTNLHCSGSHGLSLSVGMSKTSYDDNFVQNITFFNNTMENCGSAIHVKTHNDGGPGAIKDVTYQDIAFSGIVNYGINIQEDYANGGSTGTAIGNVPITNLQMINIHGTLSGEKAMPVYIFCGTDGCSDWSWSDVSISGGKKDSKCNFEPEGYSC